jgi:hypothetical protein
MCGACLFLTKPGVINILKCTYETEIQSAFYHQTTAIRENVMKKWECIKIILV